MSPLHQAPPPAIPPAQTATKAPSAPTMSTQQAALLDVERQRLDAEVKADVPAIGNLLSGDLVYLHGNGLRQTKAEYLHAVTVGESRYRSIETGDRSAVIYGSVGVTHGNITLHLATGQSVVARYSGVYLLREDRWLLVSWQSTPIQDEQAKAKAAAGNQMIGQEVQHRNEQDQF